MGLSFLAPFFFAGLAALAIPIIVHLTYRQKATVVPFPSLMFLRKVPFRSLRRQKIRHWLLFLAPPLPSGGTSGARPGGDLVHIR